MTRMTKKMMTQQRETLSYFNAFAKDWLRKSGGDSASQVNTIRQRNSCVLDWLDAHPSSRALLDVGCGTGDLVLAAARRGLHAVGVDFADKMIGLAARRAKSERLASAEFACASVFDFQFQTAGYDAISANGFIEYISIAQLHAFLKKSHRGLKANGAIILGSRNRLFNLYSLNGFTKDEIGAGTVGALLDEAVAWANARSIKDLRGVVPAALPKQDRRQANTGIDVSIRRQFTPLQLARILKSEGFTAVDVFPIHIHGMPPKFKGEHPAMHAQVSNLLQQYGKARLELLPFASSFMIIAKKTPRRAR
jgi:2-polyprenyl-3-methyl-5-hydroxy-6-metoxy-1,4-benzoquinol methylase